jgi:hypothetical protein
VRLDVCPKRRDSLCEGFEAGNRIIDKMAVIEVSSQLKDSVSRKLFKIKTPGQFRMHKVRPRRNLKVDHKFKREDLTPLRHSFIQ